MIQIKTKGIEDVEMTLRETGERGGNLTPAWKKIIELFTRQEKQVFDKQGPGWEPLNPHFAAHKAAQGYKSRILVQTGRLRMSVTDIASNDFVSRIRPRGVEIATKVPYAKYHEKGTKHMPARSLRRWAANSTRESIRLIREWILK